MKFIYEYRTKDNIRHEGVINAASRDAAFAALKAQGIRPGSVKEAPGVWNKLFGKGKRWIAIVLLAIIAIISMTFALHKNESITPSFIADSAVGGAMRRQILGDSAIIEKGVRTHERSRDGQPPVLYAHVLQLDHRAAVLVHDLAGLLVHALSLLSVWPGAT